MNSTPKSLWRKKVHKYSYVLCTQVSIFDIVPGSYEYRYIYKIRVQTNRRYHRKKLNTYESVCSIIKRKASRRVEGKRSCTENPTFPRNIGFWRLKLDRKSYRRLGRPLRLFWKTKDGRRTDYIFIAIGPCSSNFQIIVRMTFVYIYGFTMHNAWELGSRWIAKNEDVSLVIDRAFCTHSPFVEAKMPVDVVSCLDVFRIETSRSSFAVKRRLRIAASLGRTMTCN